jgi:HK97 family phage major capsid protein
MKEEAGRFYILGIEVLFTEKVPTLGDEGDIVLADFSQYVVGMRKEVTLDKSGHFGFDKDETYFRSILRADGMGRWSGPMKPRNGPNTLSWCVTLAARA